MRPRGNFSVPSIIKVGDDIYLATKTFVKTFSVVTSGSIDDYAFNNAIADAAEQFREIPNIIPAFAEIVSVQLRCFETVSDGSPAVMALDCGLSSGSAELLSVADIDSVGNLSPTGVGASPRVLPTTGVRSIWLNAKPDVNWSTLSAGRWSLIITYHDFGAVYDTKNI